MDNYDSNGLIKTNSEAFLSASNFMKTRGYELKEAIGCGSYAEVYSAWNPANNREVAVKVIDTTAALQTYGLTFRSRETGIIGQLRHRNVVRVYEMLKTKDKIYVAMELGTNGSIAAMLSKYGPFTEFMAWLMFRSVVEGLHHMHSHKIAHRNLKLENILLSERLNPKISDFCYAKILNNETLRTEEFFVSSAYMAPEVLQHLPHNPFVADIWSLGVCLYIMLYDCIPFNGNRISEVIEKQITRELSHKTVGSDVSVDIKLLFRDVFETDINRRATTDSLLKLEWLNNGPSS